MIENIVKDVSVLPDWQQDKSWGKLQAWFMCNQPGEHMIWKKPAENQIMFIRDEVPYRFGELLNDMDVISTHRSKSILLPVYYVELNGVKLIMRGNFHDWKVSVESDTELHFPLELFSHLDEDINDCYCEGFKEEWVYPSYLKNKKKFTVEIYSKNLLFTFFFLLHIQIK